MKKTNRSKISQKPNLTVIDSSKLPAEEKGPMSKHPAHNETELRERVARKLDGTRIALKELFKTLDEVNNMVSVIRDVAGKTDLLALNASIEAARAGHAGKGFAIVADEVGRLSEKVQQAVSAVEVSCNTLRDNIGSVAEGIEDTAKTVSENKPSVAA